MKRYLRVIFFALLLAVVAAGVSMPDPSGDLLDQAMSSFRNGNADDALSKAREIGSAGLSGGTGMADFIAGQCYVKKSNDAEAARYFESAASSKDEDFVLLDYAIYSLARTYEKLGRNELAYREYERIASEYPNSALAPESFVALGKSAAAKGDHKGAIEIYDTAISSSNDEDLICRAKFLKGRSLESLGRWKDAADQYFDLVFNGPANPLKGDARKRIAWIVKAKRIPYPSASREEYFKRAMSHYDSGDYYSASLELLNFLKNYKYGLYSNKARLYLGISQLKRKRYSNAAYHFNRLIASGATESDQAQFELSFVYGAWRNLRGALASLRKVIARYPKSDFCDDAAFYVGYYYEINGYKSRALQEYLSMAKRFPKSSRTVNALFRAGRMQYYDGDYRGAYRTFATAVDEVPRAELSEYCLFWKGMAALKLGERDNAKNSFLRLVREFDHTFHSYQARARLRQLGVSEDEIKYAESSFITEKQAVDEMDLIETELAQGPLPSDDIRSHIAKYAALSRIGFYEHAEREAKYLMSAYPDEEKGKAKMLYFLAMQNKGDYRRPISFAEGSYLSVLRNNSLSYYDYQLWKLAYPRGFWDYVLRYSVQYQLDPYLTLALIREESRFNPKTLSWARAHGLMQIIPPTGLSIARLIGVRPYNKYMLFDPETNIRMGCYYLSSLMKRFDGNPYYALAAYNGGPMRVKAWLVRWRNEKGYDIDIDEFLEAIPLYETRRYVKKVIKSYNEYKRIYEQKKVEIAPSTRG